MGKKTFEQVLQASKRQEKFTSRFSDLWRPGFDFHTLDYTKKQTHKAPFLSNIPYSPKSDETDTHYHIHRDTHIPFSKQVRFWLLNSLNVDKTFHLFSATSKSGIRSTILTQLWRFWKNITTVRKRSKILTITPTSARNTRSPWQMPCTQLCSKLHAFYAVTHGFEGCMQKARPYQNHLEKMANVKIEFWERQQFRRYPISQCLTVTRFSLWSVWRFFFFFFFSQQVADAYSRHLSHTSMQLYTF